MKKTYEGFKKCPQCGKETLTFVPMWNPEVMGPTKEDEWSEVCQNSECKGWYCDYCEKYHVYGSICSVALVRDIREEDDGWRWHQ